MVVKFLIQNVCFLLQPVVTSGGHIPYKRLPVQKQNKTKQNKTNKQTTQQTNKQPNKQTNKQTTTMTTIYDWRRFTWFIVQMCAIKFTCSMLILLHKTGYI